MFGGIIEQIYLNIGEVAKQTKLQIAKHHFKELSLLILIIFE